MSAPPTLALELRDVPPRSAYTLEQAGLHPLLARLYAARGVSRAEDLDAELKHLLPPDSLTHARQAAQLLADAMGQGHGICVVADYDCDGATACAVGYAAHHQQLRHDVFVPIVDKWVPLGAAWYLLVFFIIVGAANAVNLTDGLDGLAAGTSIISLMTLTAMAVTIYIRSGVLHHRIENRLDAAFIGAAVIGAAVGFLWFNAFPAEVFMGDTGSMALGGAIGAMAIFLKVELLLLLVGGIFVVEAVSVMLQVFWFKLTKKHFGEGRRIFRMAPLHHHFELGGWKETQVVVRFSIITILLVLIGLSSLKLR